MKKIQLWEPNTAKRTILLRLCFAYDTYKTTVLFADYLQQIVLCLCFQWFRDPSVVRPPSVHNPTTVRPSSGHRPSLNNICYSYFSERIIMKFDKYRFPRCLVMHCTFSGGLDNKLDARRPAWILTTSKAAVCFRFFQRRIQMRRGSRAPPRHPDSTLD